MGIFRRLKNLWHLSAIELPEEKKDTKGVLKKMFSRHAVVVSMHDPIVDLKLD